MPGLSVYFHVAQKSFQKQLVYRAANVAGILTNTFFGAIYVFLFTALYQNRGQVGGLDRHDTITYVVLTQSLLMVMSAFGNRDLSDAIIKGEIVADLARPLDFYTFWAALDLGRSAYYLLFRGVPTFVLGCVLFGAGLPANGTAWLVFLASLALGAAISFAFRFITASLAFWTSDARGITYLTSTVMMFFAGFIVPLNFLPPAWQPVVAWLPFRALAHLPVSIYLGKIGSGEVVQAFAVEMAWLLLLGLAGRLLLGAMVRRLSVHGG